MKLVIFLLFSQFVVSDSAIIKSFYVSPANSQNSKVCMYTEEKNGSLRPFLCHPLNNGQCPSFAVCRSGVSGGGDGGEE